MSNCGCSSTTPTSDYENTPNTAMPSGGQDLLAGTSGELAECPVMPGSMIEKTRAEAEGMFRDYEGKRYWFCCKGCGPRFDADPLKYISA